MRKRSPLRTANEKPIYCVEVILDGTLPPKWIDLVFSIAGRESTFTRRWSLTCGLLDSDAAVDLTTAVAGSIMDAITMMGGVQEKLPLS